MILGIPAVFALSFVTWHGHLKCPLARGALALAGIEVVLLLLLLVVAGAIPHLG